MKTTMTALMVLLCVFVSVQISSAQFVKMNEIYSRGVTADPDWIEIYNGSSTAVDISGYKIYDNGGQGGTKPKKLFSAGTVIPANGFFVIVTDDTTASGFGLSSSGETVWLENAGGTIIDSIAFPALAVTESYARKPNGSAWGISSTLTRGFSNTVAVMNEIYTRGTAADPDWIEIYNVSSAALDISGYKIYDNGGQGGTKPKKLFPAGTTIPANGFVVIVTDDTSSSGFGLSSSGETVWLENAAGVIIDSVVFPALATTQTYARISNGGPWQITSTITRGTSNILTDVSEREGDLRSYKLDQNYPNPFNPMTTIRFQVPGKALVTLQVFDVLGRLVRTLVNESLDGGTYDVRFDGVGLSSGVYYYTLRSGSFSETKALTLVR